MEGLVARVCNRCSRTDAEVTFQPRTLRCRKCTREIWDANKIAEGLDPAQLRREKHLTQRYGKGTPEYYVKAFEAQGGVCKICRSPEWKMRNGRLLDLCIDHCHETGALRGLLCHQCNTAIGWFNDDPKQVERAMLYLKGEL